MRTIGWVVVAVVVGVAVGAAGMFLGTKGFAAVKPTVSVSLPSLPPAPSAVTITRETPNVLRAVSEMARLETVSFHMERVIDRKKVTPRLRGLWDAEEKILLIAAADVTAGVDLKKLRAEDVVVDPEKMHVELTLPKPEVFSSALNNKLTRLYSWEKDWTASHDETQETIARRDAEKSLHAAALEAGILEQAGDSARKTVEGLLRSLGFHKIRVKFKSDESGSPAASSSAQPRP